MIKRKKDEKKGGREMKFSDFRAAVRITHCVICLNWSDVTLHRTKVSAENTFDMPVLWEPEFISSKAADFANRLHAKIFRRQSGRIVTLFVWKQPIFICLLLYPNASKFPDPCWNKPRWIICKTLCGLTGPVFSAIVRRPRSRQDSNPLVDRMQALIERGMLSQLDQFDNFQIN